MEVFERLRSCDILMQSGVHRLLQSFNELLKMGSDIQNWKNIDEPWAQKYAEMLSHWREGIDEHICISGSSVEVGAICRSARSGLYELEWDKMEEIGRMTEEVASQYLVPVEGILGFYYVRPDFHGSAYICDDFKETRTFFEMFKSISIVQQSSICLSNREVVNEMTKDSDEYVNTDVLKAIRSPLFTPTGPSAMTKVPISLYFAKLRVLPLLYSFIGASGGYCSIDNVYCIALKFTPDCVVSWLSNRDELWPPSDVRQEILVNGFHIVSKNAPGFKNSWHLSTSFAEKLLFDKMTGFQRLVYLAAKTVFYLHLKNGECRYNKIGEENQEILSSLPSYLIKTVFFEFLRNKSQKEPDFWEQEDDRRFSQALAEVFELLKCKLASKVCYSFFVPDINILEIDGVIPEDKYITITSKVLEICKNPRVFFPTNINRIEVLTLNYDLFIKTVSTIICVERNAMSSSKQAINTALLLLECKDVFQKYNRLEHSVDDEFTQEEHFFRVGFRAFWEEASKSYLFRAAEQRPFLELEREFCAKIYVRLVAGSSYQITEFEEQMISLGRINEDDKKRMESRRQATSRHDSLEEGKSYCERYITEGKLDRKGFMGECCDGQVYQLNSGRLGRLERCGENIIWRDITNEIQYTNDNQEGSLRGESDDKQICRETSQDHHSSTFEMGSNDEGHICCGLRCVIM
ncbi:uncharacterized protein LOC125556668 [Nematostella vectensis]|uniref:uncharacterized protein LOC125556668 n=1 Tax=Nematostella vectensis TaxID=45351 RepID=UPI00207720C4|nr:uncharacterized protein LOC125556668 [Nematostella vectensis]